MTLYLTTIADIRETAAGANRDSCSPLVKYMSYPCKRYTLIYGLAELDLKD